MPWALPFSQMQYKTPSAIQTSQFWCNLTVRIFHPPLSLSLFLACAYVTVETPLSCWTKKNISIHQTSRLRKLCSRCTARWNLPMQRSWRHTSSLSAPSTNGEHCRADSYQNSTRKFPSSPRCYRYLRDPALVANAVVGEKKDALQSW